MSKKEEEKKVVSPEEEEGIPTVSEPVEVDVEETLKEFDEFVDTVGGGSVIERKHYLKCLAVVAAKKQVELNSLAKFMFVKLMGRELKKGDMAQLSKFQVWKRRLSRQLSEEEQFEVVKEGKSWLVKQL